MRAEYGLATTGATDNARGFGEDDINIDAHCSKRHSAPLEVVDVDCACP